MHLSHLVPCSAELVDIFGDLSVTNIYEIHITVKCTEEGVPRFRETSVALGVKPLVVQLAEGRVMNDVMTSSDIKCTPSELMDECSRLVNGLSAAGWPVVRCKVETTPWHPKALVPEEQMKPYQYFESHIPIRVNSAMNLDPLRKQCKEMGLHLSANAFKVHLDERTVMSTFRATHLCADEFKATVAQQCSTLKDSGFNLDVPVVEFAIFDSNRDHDNEWLHINKA